MNNNYLPTDYQAFIHTSRYARWLEDENRRETWPETVRRYMDNVVKPIVITKSEYKLDLIIYATGFNAITGSFDRMEIRGLNGQTLKTNWDSGPSTFLSMQVGDFPNLLMINGPQGFGGNHPRNIVGDC